MFEGWWVAFGFSGLWISIGVLIWMILRDYRRRQKRREEAARKMIEEVLGTGRSSVEDLEKQYGQRG
ncbi:hypothetical protein JW916_09790 [Candidatus Sumerlaeota bacterium]|nr:hypothetical protein [Candidatus Sumerlaeota bacterium]